MISQDEIPNFEYNVADGVTYTMEIATRKYYKVLKYHCPEKFALKEINNRKFVDLIFMIDKHLHFYIPFCKSDYKPDQ
jgi:hypothetical protein